MLNFNSIKQKICSHKTYTVIRCNMNDKYYTCKCEKCNAQFDKNKTIGEVYELNTILKEG